MQQPLVDALLGDPRQLRLGGHLLDVRVEGASPVGAPVAGPAALGPPVRRHGVPVLAVALRYVAEVGLYARFPVHVQLSDQVLLRHGRSSRKHRSLVGRSVSPGVGGNGENALAQMAGLRWWNWLMCDGQNGCFYSSANRGRIRRSAASAPPSSKRPIGPRETAARRRRKSRRRNRGGSRFSGSGFANPGIGGLPEALDVRRPLSRKGPVRRRGHRARQQGPEEGAHLSAGVRRHRPAPPRARPMRPAAQRGGDAFGAGLHGVGVNVNFTIFTNAFSPIAPTRIRRIRQRGCAAFGA